MGSQWPAVFVLVESDCYRSKIQVFTKLIMAHTAHRNYCYNITSIDFNIDTESVQILEWLKTIQWLHIN